MALQPAADLHMVQFLGQSGMLRNYDPPCVFMFGILWLLGLYGYLTLAEPCLSGNRAWRHVAETILPTP